MTDIYVFEKDALQQIVGDINPSQCLLTVIDAFKKIAALRKYVRLAVELVMLAALSTGVSMCAVGLAMRFTFQS